MEGDFSLMEGDFFAVPLSFDRREKSVVLYHAAILRVDCASALIWLKYFCRI